MGFHRTEDGTYNSKFYEAKGSINDEILACSSVDDQVCSERRNSAVSEKVTTILDSIKLFFGKPRSASNDMSYTRQCSQESSSGYQSLETSSELDDSYIKVSKFTEHEGNGEHGHYGTFKEYKEMAQQQNLATEIKEIVENDPIRNIKISDYLTLRTAGNVMDLSKSEPYGLKGCKLILVIEDDDDVIHLGNVFPEKGIICTFEITLVLHLKRNPCRRIPFLNCKQGKMQVLEQYELRKEKMYTSRSRKSSPTFRS